MKQGLLPYRVEVVEEADAVTARGGLPLAVEAMRALGVSHAVKQNVRIRQRASGSDEVAMTEALVLLLAAGGECIDDMAVLRADHGLCRLLERELPSPAAVRRFLYEFHDEELIEQARQQRAPGQVAYIPGENAALGGLAQVNVQLLARVAAQGRSSKATLDHDATIQESHKRESLAHYKGGRGYQPSVIYWAEQDLVVADEYRDGNVPAGMDNLRLIQRGFASLPATVTEYGFRADSACYEEQVLKWLANPERKQGPRGKIRFTISADMSPELRAVCEGVGQQRWLLVVVSNRWELSGEQLLQWHWAKAGTIEHVHDVTKNELGAAVPPCGRFGANAAWYRLSLLAYNILSAMKSLVLPAPLGAARPKRLRFALFTIAGRLISHADKLVLRISQAAERLAGLVEARRRLAALAAASP